MRGSGRGGVARAIFRLSMAICPIFYSRQETTGPSRAACEMVHKADMLVFWSTKIHVLVRRNRMVFLKRDLSWMSYWVVFHHAFWTKDGCCNVVHSRHYCYSRHLPCGSWDDRITDSAGAIVRSAYPAHRLSHDTEVALVLGLGSGLYLRGRAGIQFCDHPRELIRGL